MTERKKTNVPAPELVLLSPKIKQDEDEKQTIFDLKQKYKDVVLFEIYVSGMMLHTVLSHRIIVSKSGLNAIIKKLNDAETPPIHISRQGKFTLYSLEEAGKEYVRDELLNSMTLDEQDTESVHNIFRLLNAFKDQNPNNWVEILNNILDDADSFDEYEEGKGFIKELSNYYSHYCDGAEVLLGLAITDKELQKKIIEYLQDNRNKNFANAWEVLNYWEQEDVFEAYRLIDSIFEIIVGKEKFPDCNSFLLTDVALHIEKVLDKIQAGLLQALLRKMSKKEAIQLWLGHGLEKHLAIYLAEKYITDCFQYEETREEKKSCI